MNHTVTSKEKILETSKKLIMEQGWTAVNIRSVAAACNVAVGSIYNYFPSKADLVTATVESIWREVLHLSAQEEENFHSFSDCILWFFRQTEKGNRKYPGFFKLHSMSFLGTDKKPGQEKMYRSWEHMKKQLTVILLQDKTIRPDAFDEQFTPEKLIDIIFSLLVSSMMREDYDGSIIVEIIRRTLY